MISGVFFSIKMKNDFGIFFMIALSLYTHNAFSNMAILSYVHNKNSANPWAWGLSPNSNVFSFFSIAV
jgi:hypothetical protein